MKMLELFFHTLWWAYLNICLCFGYTPKGMKDMDILDKNSTMPMP